MTRKIDSRVVSPSQILAYRNNPVAYLMNKYIKGSGRGTRQVGDLDAAISGSIETTTGTAIHKAVEEAISVVSSAIPGGASIEQAILRGTAAAETALRIRGVSLAENMGAVSDTIRHVATRWNKRVNKHIAAGVDPKTVFQKVRLETETTQMAVIGTGPTANIIRGFADIPLVDEIDRVAHVIDIKHLASADGLSKLGQYEYQAKPYQVALLKSYDVDRVTFGFAASVPQADGSRTLHHVSLPSIPEVNWKVLPSVEKEIVDVISEMRSMESTAQSKVRSGGIDTLKEWVRKEVIQQLNSGELSATQQHIPSGMELNWTFSGFMNTVMDTEGLNGERFLTSQVRRKDRGGNTEKLKRATSLFSGHIDREVEQAAKQLRTELLSEGKDALTIARMVASQTSELRRSYEALRLHKRGRFEDAITKGVFQAHGKLPFSIIDPHFPQPWINDPVRREIEQLTRDRIRSISAALDTPFELVEREVTDSLFTDKDFASKLFHTVVEDVRNELQRNNLPLSAQHVKGILNRPQKIAGARYPHVIDEGVTDETIRQIFAQDYSAYERATGKKLNPNEMGRMESRLSDIREGLIKDGIIPKTPEKLIHHVRKSESALGKIARFRIGKPRFPVRMGIIAGMLGYMAGVDSVSSILSSKVDRAAQYLMMDDTVETGEHDSAYTTQRRLILSDFGSEVRDSTPVSSFFSKMALWNRQLLDRVKYARGAHLAKEGVGPAVTTMTKLAQVMKHVPVGSAALYAAGAIGAFVLTGFLTNVKSDTEANEEVKDRNKRFKRLKRTTWNTDSPSPVPESDLRQGYMLHTPQGSHIAVRSIAKLMDNSFAWYRNAAEFAEKATGYLWKEKRNKLESPLRRLLGEFAEAKATVTSIPSQRIKDGVEHIADDTERVIQEAAQYGRQNAAASSARKKVAEVYERAEQVGRRKTLTITDPEVPQSARKRGYVPVVTERGASTRETIITGTARHRFPHTPDVPVTTSNVPVSVPMETFPRTSLYESVEVPIASASRERMSEYFMIRTADKTYSYPSLTSTTALSIPVIPVSRSRSTTLPEYTVNRHISLTDRRLYDLVNTSWKTNKWGAEQNVQRLYAFFQP